LGVLICWNL